MNRALIVGGSGFVGRYLFAHFGGERATATWCSKPVEGMIRFDATSEKLVDLLRRLPSDISHVFVPFGTVNPELCAKEPEATAGTNVDAVIRVLRDALDAGLVPIFVSTDYVFDGTRGSRTEDEPQNPNTEYGRQKAIVERWLQEVQAPWLITRLSKVVNGDPTIHSVLGPWVNDIRAGKLMRSATDQIFSPALVDDIARALIQLAEQGRTGIFHVAGPEALSRYALNKLLVDAVRTVAPTVDAVVEPCSLREIPFREFRPLNTSLSVTKLESVLESPFCRMVDLCDQIARAEFGRS